MGGKWEDYLAKSLKELLLGIRVDYGDSVFYDCKPVDFGLRSIRVLDSVWLKQLPRAIIPNRAEQYQNIGQSLED